MRTNLRFQCLIASRQCFGNRRCPVVADPIESDVEDTERCIALEQLRQLLGSVPCDAIAAAPNTRVITDGLIDG